MFTTQNYQSFSSQTLYEMAKYNFDNESLVLNLLERFHSDSRFTKFSLMGEDYSNELDLMFLEELKSTGKSDYSDFLFHLFKDFEKKFIKTKEDVEETYVPNFNYIFNQDIESLIEDREVIDLFNEVLFLKKRKGSKTDIKVFELLYDYGYNYNEVKKELGLKNSREVMDIEENFINLLRSVLKDNYGFKFDPNLERFHNPDNLSYKASPFNRNETIPNDLKFILKKSVLEYLQDFHLSKYYNSLDIKDIDMVKDIDLIFLDHLYNSIGKNYSTFYHYKDKINKYINDKKEEEKIEFIRFNDAFNDTTYDEDPLTNVYSEELKDTIQYLLTTLTLREQLIIKKRFFDQKTFRDIAKELGVTPERIRQIEARALRKFRHPVRSKLIRVYY